MNSTVRAQVERAMRGLQFSSMEMPSAPQAPAAPSDGARAMGALSAPPAPSATHCEVCKERVLDTDDRTVRGQCSHLYHTNCLVPLIKAGRQYCSACPPPTLDAPSAAVLGGFTVDLGNDADVRRAVADALQYQRNQVRSSGVFVCWRRFRACLQLTLHRQINRRRPHE